MREYLNLILTIALANRIIIRSFKIALVVGLVLNLINQGELIIAYDLTNLNFTKLVLTFLVPFCVSMYTAITMKINFP